MKPQERHHPRFRALCCWLCTYLILLSVNTLSAEEPGLSSINATDPDSRFDRLEQRLQSVIDENRWLSGEVQSLREQLNSREVPPTPAADFAVPVPALTPDEKTTFRPRYSVGYDNGFVIVPDDPVESPFSLKVNNQNTVRYTGFIADEPTWTDSAGNVLPISNSSNFAIPRGRVIFSGNAFMPGMSYLLNIDYNSVTNNPIGFRAYVLSYKFSRAAELSVGQNKVPGSREWLGSSFVAQEGPDRTMATTFFRPSLSQGMWLTGEPADGVYYHAMLSNGFNTLNITPDRLNNFFCWSGSAWWEPLGDFGKGYADIEAHDDWACRVGTSLTVAREQGSQANSNAPENSSIRLSDGTIITQPGAFAPGVTLLRYDIGLAAIDMAFKYRGFSISSEGYVQQLSSLEGTAPLPVNSTRAYGGFLQGGYFVVPQEVEVYSRTSWVKGAYGGGTEVAGGFNWFLLKGKANPRFTLDAAWLNHSPADQSRTGFVAGQSGLLIRTQITTAF